MDKYGIKLKESYIRKVCMLVGHDEEEKWESVLLRTWYDALVSISMWSIIIFVISYLLTYSLSVAIFCAIIVACIRTSQITKFYKKEEQEE